MQVQPVELKRSHGVNLLLNEILVAEVAAHVNHKSAVLKARIVHDAAFRYLAIIGVGKLCERMRGIKQSGGRCGAGVHTVAGNVEHISLGRAVAGQRVDNREFNSAAALPDRAVGHTKAAVHIFRNAVALGGRDSGI